MFPLLRSVAAAAFLTAALVVPASAQDQDSLSSLNRKADQVFAAFDKPDSPGCALGVIRDGKFLYKRGYGTASLELGVPIASDSVFYLGSISKQFTAASVVLAAEQGFLSLDDDVRKYIPELPSYAKPVTLREMLHHTSGFRDIYTLLFLAGRNFEDIHPTAELLDLVSHQKALDFDPGDEYQYSNTNFFLMGIVIRRATGKPLSQFADENIFKPLGMSHTRFYDDRTVVVPGRVPAYDPGAASGFRVNWSTNFEKVGDGGLMSTLDDLFLWDRNFYDNKLGKGGLPRELQTPGVLNNGKSIEYALGLFTTRYRGLPVLAHSGALFGYRTAFFRFPAQRFSVLCLCNVGSSNPVDLAERITDIYLAPQLSPAPAPPSTSGGMDLSSLAGSYRDARSHSVVKVTASKDGIEAFGLLFHPRDSTHFTGPEENEMTVEPRPSGGVRLTLLAKDALPQIFERYEAVKLSGEDLAQFAGEYTSAELEVTYRLFVKEGKLTLAINWQEPLALEPTIRDEFQSPYGTDFVFRRDSAGRIAAFDAFAGSVGPITFLRTSK
ncbi:MAG TPA: serine hydrolase domain-containing protein [Candidatus Acidoferrum sp.]|nr:serine hydrolase domain-containing protein [Candidatus Acidoferrum sp.]